MKMIKKQNGFSLIEVIIALIFISLIFVGILRAYNNTIGSSAELKAHAIAINLARQRIEDLKKYDGMGLNRNNDVWKEDDTLTNTINGITYTTTTSILTTDAASLFNDNQYIPIRVVVSWQFRGKDKSVTMDTCYTQNQLN